MQITIACPNCQQVLFGAALMKVDVASSDATCSKCGAIYRVTVSCLHDGKKTVLKDKPMGYCSQCEPKVPFFNSDDMREHDIKVHGRKWKG